MVKKDEESGKTEEKEGRDIFLSGLLYPILEECKRLGCSVSVYAGENYTSLERMTEYFLERGVLPDIRIFADDGIMDKVSSSLCGKRENIRKISAAAGRASAVATRKSSVYCASRRRQILPEDIPKLRMAA